MSELLASESCPEKVKKTIAWICEYVEYKIDVSFITEPPLDGGSLEQVCSADAPIRLQLGSSVLKYNLSADAKFGIELLMSGYIHE